jgi:hypothetical protein
MSGDMTDMEGAALQLPGVNLQGGAGRRSQRRSRFRG